MSKGEQILTAAIRHLNTDPTASMGRIAEAAGVSRATLHRYYATREELLRALGEQAMDRWEQSQRSAGIEAAAASGDPAVLEEALHALMRAFTVDADEHGFALTDHFVNHLPELVRRGEELEEREIVFYAACQRAGVLRADLPARWVSNTVYGLMVTVRDSLRNGDVARRDIERLMITTFLAGTADRPGETPGERR
ncbi:TetR/AcrR family transcriptional regulator [Actinomadura macrotermitis]|uniref:HTH tetR-type domain-containing protein n=1 Tax=Actinomadura macrotermitis TaxID=2585200 RepID=A0A7K0BS15_9ACTN|nr:TetR/AcrR family transcriptional regulator [Actinomadura macrotermitis]MQY03990.1 hypothetical protein [Actinomadura macrotermitis]